MRILDIVNAILDILNNAKRMLKCKVGGKVGGEYTGVWASRLVEDRHHHKRTHAAPKSASAISVNLSAAIARSAA